MSLRPTFWDANFGTRLAASSSPERQKTERDRKDDDEQQDEAEMVSDTRDCASLFLSLALLLLVSVFFFLPPCFVFFLLLVFPPNRSRAERLSLELLLRQSLFAAAELVLFQLSVVESHRYS
jgi:hypothetical protein